MDEREISHRFQAALEVELPPGAAERLSRRLAESGTRGKKRRGNRQWATLAALLLALAIPASIVVWTSRLKEAGPVETTPALTAADQAQLVELRARPLHLPPMPADGFCPIGPRSDAYMYRGSPPLPVSSLGAGGVYLLGHATYGETSKAGYADYSVATDPRVRGPVLIRMRSLDDRVQAFFIGRYSSGPVVGTDVIEGRVVEQRAEMVLPSGSAPPDPLYAPGWRIWSVRLGIVPPRTTGCKGFQVDTVSGSGVFVDGG